MCAIVATGGTELQVALWQTHLPLDVQSHIHLTVSSLDTPTRPLKPHIFWAHQASDQPSVQNLRDPLVQQGIDAFVFVSDWQRVQYQKHLRIPLHRSYVIRNAIDPIPHHDKPQEPLRLIYTSTPFRGLDVLLEAFKGLSASENVELHIYSGMALYGRATEDTRFADLYEQALQTPGVYYHGVVPNSELRRALTESHIFAYPCTWEETSCVALIEALSAGCLAVVPDLAALPETASGYAQLYPYTTDKAEHVARFQTELRRMIDQYRTPATTQRLQAQVAFFHYHYDWQRRVGEWIALTQHLINLYGRRI